MKINFRLIKPLTRARSLWNGKQTSFNNCVLTKHYHSSCEVFFNGWACFYIINFHLNPNCIHFKLIAMLRYFRSKGRRLAPFSENFQKEQDKIWSRNYPLFLSVPHAALLLCRSTSLQISLGTFLSVKRW